MDHAGAVNILRLKGCSIVESYRTAVDEIIRIIGQQRMTNSAATITSGITQNFNSLSFPKVNLTAVNRIVFIRHAQRLDEIMDEWCDFALRPQDSPITTLGITQAIAVGNWCSSQSWCNNSNIKAIYCSPFYRTVHTAHLIIEQIISRHGNYLYTNNIHNNNSPKGSNKQNQQSSNNNNNTTITAVSNNHNNSLRNTQLGINIENGLCEEPDWMGNNAKPTKPWYLKAGDLCCMSNHIYLPYNSCYSP